MYDRKLLREELRFRCSLTMRDYFAIKTMLERLNLFEDHEIEVALELTADCVRKGAMSSYFFIVADYMDKAAGFICYGPIAMAEHRFDIYWIAVDRTMHGRGIGSLLISEAESKITGSGGQYIFIDTSSRDEYRSARELYRKCGYHHVASIPDYYAENDDKVMLMKNVRPAVHVR